YEIKNGATLCHVIADGKRIASFEPISSTASFIQNTPVLAQMYKGACFLSTWPFDEGRAPLTTALMPCFGILGLLRCGRRRSGETDVRLPRRISLVSQAFWIFMSVLMFLVTTPQLQAGTPVYGPVFYFYHGDHLGSASILTDRG